MSCDRVRAQLTSYLDGELEGDRGTIVRGHLRSCDACRQIAADEAVVRDGLRALPSIDPPAAMWAGVQARLAAEEVTEANRPAWRRAVTRWRGWMPSGARLAAGSLVAAAAVAAVWWKAGGAVDQATTTTTYLPPPKIEPQQQPVVAASACGDEPGGDVTADLAAEPKRITSCYQQTIDELLGVAHDMRPGWSDDHKTAFDAKVRAMHDTIANAGEGKPRQRAARAMIRYLEGAVIRDDVVLASGGAR